MKTVILPPQETFLKKAPDASMMKPVRNLAWVKPEGGLWTSTKDTSEDYGWRWFAGIEMPQWLTEATPYTLTPVKPVAQIDSYADFVEILDRFPFDDDWGSRSIDFEAMSLYYSGLNLTMEGQYTTRLSAPNLYGWDCESTVWFEWAFAD